MDHLLIVLAATLLVAVILVLPHILTIPIYEELDDDD